MGAGGRQSNERPGLGRRDWAPESHSCGTARFSYAGPAEDCRGIFQVGREIILWEADQLIHVSSVSVGRCSRRTEE
jgi:hypothetical protein